MTKILATDLDGTLFYPRRTFSLLDKKTIKFLRDFIDQGNKLCLVSGRNIQIAARLEKVLERNVDMIGCNGALIRLDGQLVKEASFNNEHLKSLIDYIYGKYSLAGFLLMSDKYSLVMDTKRTKFIMKSLYWLYRISQGKRADAIKINGKIFQDEVDHGNVHKLMLFIGIKKAKKELAKEINKELREKYAGEFECAWSDEVIEISPAGSHKASALLEYLKMQKMSKDDIYVIGDSGNDISMFNEFHDNSFCMNHASSTVKKYAKHIVERVYNIKDYIL